ncbi:lysozyme [Folsomia candida]|uniref:lysozyme n=1 Tax=Folsomia candida TaxID=158441 RepID=UPI000B907998|nr:lysozyme [Folsomia candida]
MERIYSVTFLLFFVAANFMFVALSFPQQDFGNEQGFFNSEFPDSSSKRGINPMTESCLACICQASTNCNLTTRCISSDKYCGPFLISKPYWLDAGQLTIKFDEPSRDGAFFACATDPICAAQTVRTYMLRYQTDCNNDGIIDCDDMGRTHLMGADDCSNQRVTSTPFFKRFRKCYDAVLQLNAS